jgi:hypothetical protein
LQARLDSAVARRPMPRELVTRLMAMMERSQAKFDALTIH